MFSNFLLVLEFSSNLLKNLLVNCEYLRKFMLLKIQKKKKKMEIKIYPL